MKYFQIPNGSRKPLVVICISVSVIAISILGFLGGTSSGSLANSKKPEDQSNAVTREKSRDADSQTATLTKDEQISEIETATGTELDETTPSESGSAQAKITADVKKKSSSNPVTGYPSGILIRKVDVGPGTSSFGHTPVTTFKTWPGGSVIKDGIIPRDSDGWLRIRGYEFSGATKLEAGNVEIIDSRFLPGNQSGTIDGDKCSYYPAILYSSSTPPAGELVLDHVSIDQGSTGWTFGGLSVYMKTTLRYSHIVGPRSAINAMSDSLYEHNYLEGTKVGTECNKYVFNGIKGSYQKVNWTARHNTIISSAGVTSQDNLWAASCINNSVNGNGEAKISYGILVENNYCNGFRWGVALDGTDPNNMNIVRNNFFGTDFVNNGSNRVDMNPDYPHSIVEDNNVVNMDFVESIGSVRPSSSGLLPELSL